MMLLLLSSKGQGLESSGRTDIYRVGLLLKLLTKKYSWSVILANSNARRYHNFNLIISSYFNVEIKNHLMKSNNICVSKI